MLDRLKSLPLTIVLTILIWMYAESQFTATRENLQVSLTIAATPQYVVDMQDVEGDKEYHKTVAVRITLQGARDKVEKIYQQQMGVVTPDPAFMNQVYQPNPGELRLGKIRSTRWRR